MGQHDARVGNHAVQAQGQGDKLHDRHGIGEVECRVAGEIVNLRLAEVAPEGDDDDVLEEEKPRFRA